MDRLLELTYRAERTHFWFRGFRRFVTPWLSQAAGGRTDLRLLDCGCGTGANLALLARHGVAFGFDLTARGLEFARAHGVNHILLGRSLRSRWQELLQEGPLIRLIRAADDIDVQIVPMGPPPAGRS